MSTHKEWIVAKKGNSQHERGQSVSSSKLINSQHVHIITRNHYPTRKYNQNFSSVTP